MAMAVPALATRTTATTPAAISFCCLVRGGRFARSDSRGFLGGGGLGGSLDRPTPVGRSAGDSVLDQRAGSGKDCATSMSKNWGSWTVPCEPAEAAVASGGRGKRPGVAHRVVVEVRRAPQHPGCRPPATRSARAGSAIALAPALSRPASSARPYSRSPSAPCHKGLAAPSRRRSAARTVAFGLEPPARVLVWVRPDCQRPPRPCSSAAARRTSWASRAAQAASRRARAGGPSRVSVKVIPHRKPGSRRPGSATTSQTDQMGSIRSRLANRSPALSCGICRSAGTGDRQLVDTKHRMHHDVQPVVRAAYRLLSDRGQLAAAVAGSSSTAASDLAASAAASPTAKPGLQGRPATPAGRAPAGKPRGRSPRSAPARPSPRAGSRRSSPARCSGRSRRRRCATAGPCRPR